MAGNSALLAVLPVFFDLDGRLVLIAGDGEGLAWKLELLASTGAQIRYVGHAGEAMAKELEQAGAKWREGDWSKDDFSGVRLAIGAFADRDEAESFSFAARQAGILVHLVDKPHLSDFSFGSIVNRSPVVVGVSTHGSSPVLAQVIRRHIEAILPLSLSEWAVAARRMRQQIAGALPDKTARRLFWGRFAEAAFSRPPEDSAAFAAEVASGSGADSGATGRVILVGAGPGDADSLTLKAIRALQSADVILHDALIGRQILELARREARCVSVGKRAGRASCAQDEINSQMLELARQGLLVVRLKSGDPSIFARAAQEMSFLRAAGIAVEMVPGISLAMAAAARLGVSLTDRDCARAVKFITAHSRNGELPDLDWRACADPQTTLIVYMGGRTANELAQTLIRHGLPATTPVVIAVDIAGNNEQIRNMRLAELEQAIIPVTHPVLLGIGQTFANLA